MFDQTPPAPEVFMSRATLALRLGIARTPVAKYVDEGLLPPPDVTEDSRPLWREETLQPLIVAFEARAKGLHRHKRVQRGRGFREAAAEAFTSGGQP